MKNSFVFNIFLKKTVFIVLVFILTLSFDVFSNEKIRVSKRGKQAAPVDIFYDKLPVNSVGVPVGINIEAVSSVNAEVLELKITTSEGLTVSGGVLEHEWVNQTAGTSNIVQVTVIPEEEGTLYLNIFTNGIFEGKKLGRSTSIPIRVGVNKKRKLRKVGNVKINSRGERVILMPAKEK